MPYFSDSALLGTTYLPLLIWYTVGPASSGYVAAVVRERTRFVELVACFGTCTAVAGDLGYRA